MDNPVEHQQSGQDTLNMNRQGDSHIDLFENSNMTLEKMKPLNIHTTL